MKTNHRNYIRRLYTLAIVLPLAGILASACTYGCAQGTEQVIAFKNVNLIPMTSKMVIEDQTLLVMVLTDYPNIRSD